MKEHMFKITIPITILVTLIAVIYQRTTGPTKPKRVMVKVEGKQIKVPFIRTFGGEGDATIELPKLTPDMSAKIIYRRYPTNEEWQVHDFMQKTGLKLEVDLPHQPPAGKFTYYVEVYSKGELVQSVGSKLDPIIIRFKGHVPNIVLVPHIFFMFFAMFLSTLTGLESFFRTKISKILPRITFTSLFIGGMCLGPLVQKYAFGVYWAGFPYDWDLTDNKVLIGVIFWTIAMLLSFTKKNIRYYAAMLAACVLMAVYSIPHSMMGSQFNYEKNQLETDR